MRRSFLVAATRSVVAALLTLPLAAQAPTHPLDGLSAAEHWAIYDALIASGKTDTTTRYLYVALHEPPKAEVLAWRQGQSFRREGFVHLVQSKKGYEAVVDITTRKLLSWKEVPARQYMVSRAEEEHANELVIKDSRVRDALKKRGVTDFTHVTCSAANEGYFDLPEERNHRVFHMVCGDDHGRTSGYGEGFDGLVIVADLTDDKILRVMDSGVRPNTGPYDNHDVEAIGQTREMKNPVSMVQPLGPSYTVNGQQVSWLNWKFQFRVDPRRGIVLSLVKFTDGGRDRSVMYQGSLSELFVPYMDPEEPWNYQSYYDLGSFPSAFGGVASSLDPGVECPSYGTLFSYWVVTDKGRPRERARAACLFERSAGDVIWRHGRDQGANVETRSKRDLVLRMFMNAGNYDYLFDWVFQQDGTLRVDIGATGMDQVKGASGKPADELYGRLIAPNLVGVNHSHFFSFRLDLDVDGPSNSLLVDQLRTELQPATNARKSLWKVQTTSAKTESDAMRHSTMSEPEIWRIVNPTVNGAYGTPVGYEVDGHGAMTLLSPDDYMQKRAGFTNHTLWVTPYNADELFAAGDYPTISVAGDGLPKWTAANRPIANTDVVAWLTMGFHHVPRPEDYPVMPVAWHSFEIRPVGFFSRNPAIDIRK
jgi:primary-amine oxidase